MTDEQIREYAHAGALTMCRRAVTEFPDILADLNQLANGNGHAAPVVPRRRGRGRPPMSAEARAKISKAMKRRWRQRTSQ